MHREGAARTYSGSSHGYAEEQIEETRRLLPRLLRGCSPLAEWDGLILHQRFQQRSFSRAHLCDSGLADRRQPLGVMTRVGRPHASAKHVVLHSRRILLNTLVGIAAIRLLTHA